MNYYGIVGEINFEYGIYGRKKGKELLYKNKAKFFDSIKESAIFSESSDNNKTFSSIDFEKIKEILNNPFIRILLPFPIRIFFEMEKSQIINLFDTSKDSEFKKIIIPNIALAGDYSLTDAEVLFGLFKNTNQFEKVMKQDGGNSNLIIVERDNLPKTIKHYGGKEGIFDYGLYCEHPKNKNILLPLANISEKVKTAILEETVRIYQGLGAKEILIEDITNVDITNNLNVKNVNVNTDATMKKEILRLKKYGQGFFNPEQALNNIFFARDYDAINSVIDGRINGNQLLEEFTETININVGLDIDVLTVFNNKTDFKYERKWHFKVEFYDKNNL